MMDRYSFTTPEGYTICNVVGSGAFANVYKAENKKTHQIVAVKVIPKSTKYSDKERVNQEIRIQQSIHHPTIAKFIEVKEDDQNVYIISEYCSHGTLARLILQNSRIPESLARKYFIQIARCLKYLHEDAHVIHRDLKADNIMLDSNDNIKIIDFGLSVEFNPSQPFIKHTCGSPKYVAPEMFSGNPYNSSVDIWALGVNLYYWVCGYYPFDESNLKKLSQKVILKDPSYPPYLSNSLIDLLKRIFVKNPLKRITSTEVINHPWTLDDSNIKKSTYNNEIRIKFAKSGILSALKCQKENDEHMPNLVGSFNKKVGAKSGELTHIFEPHGSSAVDKLCASGKFKRKEKNDNVKEKEQPKNVIVNAFLSSYAKKNNELI